MHIYPEFNMFILENFYGPVCFDAQGFTGLTWTDATSCLDDEDRKREYLRV